MPNKTVNSDQSVTPHVIIQTASGAPASAASTGTLTNVTSAASSTTLKAANTARRGIVVFNDADKALYVKPGTAASATSFSYKVAAGGTLEMPFGYTGVLSGIWEASPTGSARVTEFV